VETVEPRIQNVKVTSDAIIAYLVDGPVVNLPLVWFWRLSEATTRQRGRFELIGDGQECTGRRSMKTLALKECFTACRHIVRKSPHVWTVRKQMVVVICPTSDGQDRIGRGVSLGRALLRAVRSETWIVYVSRLPLASRASVRLTHYESLSPYGWNVLNHWN
jgi:hypothetical protein